MMSFFVLVLFSCIFFFFFFQAEDGIRDYKVTGVQTCALPISRTGKEQAGGAGADLDTSGLFGAESVTAKNGRANGSPCGANVGAIGVDDGTKRRGRRGPDRGDQERIRNQYCDNSTGDRKTVNA